MVLIKRNLSGSKGKVERVLVKIVDGYNGQGEPTLYDDHAHILVNAIVCSWKLC